MWITRLDLKNIKSYAEVDDIVFARGVNAISGPNGAGKSTLLEAIGFALFDSLPYTQGDFLRQGQKRGQVSVHFVDTLDEREYVLERPLGGSTLSIVDSETKRKLAEGKQDVVDWLKQHLGVEPTADLRALFEDAIGVPQGLLTATFLENEATRKRKFDPLLQVDDYEIVWYKLRDTLRYLRQETQTLEQRIAGLLGELKRLPDLKQEVKQLKGEVHGGEKELKAVAKRLDAASATLAALEADRKAIDDTTGRMRTIETRLEALAKQRADAAETVEASEKARQVQEETKPAYEAYESAQQELKALEEDRKERDALRQKLAGLEKELARLQTEIESLKSALAEIEVAEAELAQIQPAADRQAQLETELPQAHEAITRLSLISEQLEKERTTLEALEARLIEIEAGIQRRSKLEKESQGTEGRLRAIEAERAALETVCVGIERQRVQIVERLGLLEKTDEAICPVCRQTLDAAHRKDLERRYADERAALDRTETQSRKRMDEIEKEVNELQKTYQNLQRELNTLPLAQQEKEIKREVKQAQTYLKKQESQVEDLRQAPEHLSAIEAELTELGDPRSQVKALQTRIAARDKLESNRKSTAQKHDKNEKQAGQIRTQLADLADLDQRLADATAHRDENTAGHRRYLEHATVAESYGSRTSKLKTLDEEIRECEVEQKGFTTELQKLESGYDRAKHDQLKGEHDSLTKDHTSLETRLSMSRNRLASLVSEMDALQAKETELKSAQGERQRLEDLAKILEFVRKTVREAGPHITRALVQTISVDANRIFTEIMGEYTLRLHWNEDYSITVEQGGERRTFAQLSGGEKMAAALAVRLALLREMSQIRVAFFDEPTANLDDERRENLAAQITQITGFNQLFVISHDDTFERETHHVIRVSKVDGVSYVEVG